MLLEPISSMEPDSEEFEKVLLVEITDRYSFCGMTQFKRPIVDLQTPLAKYSADMNPFSSSEAKGCTNSTTWHADGLRCAGVVRAKERIFFSITKEIVYYYTR
jgi:hypothetical protein